MHMRKSMNLQLRARTNTKATLKRSRGNRKEQYLSWAFALPALTLMLIFLIISCVLAISFSLTNQRLAPGPLPTSFVGLLNYTRLLADDTLHRALLNNSFFGIVVVPVETGLALFLALLLNQKIRGIAVFRTIYFSPLVTPLAVIALVSSFLYNPSQGLINAFLQTISFGHLGPYTWLNDATLALPAIMFLSICQGAGLYLIFYLAGVRNTPDSL